MDRIQLTVVNHYDILNVEHGGTQAIKGLYRALSQWFDINIIFFTSNIVYLDQISLSKHIKVFPVVISNKLQEIEKKIQNHYAIGTEKFHDEVPGVMQWYHKFSEITNAVRDIAKGSLLVIAEHMYTWRIIKAACPDKHLWYREHNVEYDFKFTTWKKTEEIEKLLDEVYIAEKECCSESEHILAISSDDVLRCLDLYHFPKSMKEKFLVINAGYDMTKDVKVLPSHRVPYDAQYQYTGMFIASKNPNTARAAQNAVTIAKAFPNIKIVIAGGVGETLERKGMPKNVVITGVVSEEEKNNLLSRCDFALNLIENGAGVNIKMLEYFAFGIPVICTSHGARGIDIRNNEHCYITDMSNIEQTVNKFLNLTLEEKDNLANNAYAVLQNYYSWQSIAERVARAISNIYQFDYTKNAVPIEETMLFPIQAPAPFFPKKNFYIRCAGDYGKRLFSFLKKYSLFPIAFVDDNPKYVNCNIDGIPIISVDECIERYSGETIIVCNVKAWAEISVELLKKGIPMKELFLSFRGEYIFSLEPMEGDCPPYKDIIKYRNVILKTARCEIDC